MLSHFSNHVATAHGLLQINTDPSKKIQKTTRRLKTRQLEKPVSRHAHLFKLLEENTFISIQAADIDRQSLRVQFHLTTEFQSHFALLKGFLRLGTPPAVKLDIETDAKRFTVTVASHADREGTRYFRRVLSMLEQEVRYRQLLRAILEKEMGLKKALNSFYSTKF